MAACPLLCSTMLPRIIVSIAIFLLISELVAEGVPRQDGSGIEADKYVKRSASSDFSDTSRVPDPNIPWVSNSYVDYAHIGNVLLDINYKQDSFVN